MSAKSDGDQVIGPAPAQSERDGGTRGRILEAAAGLFTEFGFERTSMTKLARMVGISAPALYWHFPSKGALFYEFMETTLSQFVEEVEGAVDAEDPETRLRQFVRAHVLFQLDRRAVPVAYAQLSGSLSEEERARLAPLERRVVDLLRGVLVSGVDEEVFVVAEPTATTFAVITLCEYVFTWFRRDGRLSPAEVADRYADLVGRMVAAR